MHCSLLGSSIHGILQARILEWVVVPPPGDLPDPEIGHASLASPALAGEFFTIVPPGKFLAIDKKQINLLANYVLVRMNYRLCLFWLFNI